MILYVFQTVNKAWNALDAPSDKLYTWNPKSTYIKSPPFFDGLVRTRLLNQAKVCSDLDSY